VEGGIEPIGNNTLKAVDVAASSSDGTLMKLL
jgi:hypothetical protein